MKTLPIMSGAVGRTVGRADRHDRSAKQPGRPQLGAPRPFADDSQQPGKGVGGPADIPNDPLAARRVAKGRTHEELTERALLIARTRVVPRPTDSFKGLDPHVKQALGAWQSLTAEQRDYAMGFVCAWAPDVLISAASKAMDIAYVDRQLMELGVRR